MRYQLRDKEPTNLKIGQEMAIKVDRNMQASGKSNLPDFTRGNTSKQRELKDKTIASDSKASSSDPLKELTEMKELVKAMQASHAAQLNAMQTRLISMERSQVNKFQPRQNNEKCQKKGPPQDQRPPNQLEAMNVVQQETPPFCRACEEFHEESTCPVFCQINQQGFLGSNNYVGFSGRPDFINNTYTITKDQGKQNKELSKKKEDLKMDNVTRLYGEKPSPEQILEMERYKGVTYQRKGNDNLSTQQQNIPKVVAPTEDLGLDLGN
jgi:hypothetical protein